MTSTANKRIWLVALLCLMAIVAMGEIRLKDLDIQVVIADNGDAHITEVRNMSIGNEGTECYIPLRNIDGMDVTNLSVSDEKGTLYQHVGKWDTGWSRSRKANKCGLHNVDDGVEICWGLGDSGNRVYTVKYSLPNFLRSYKDKDGFFHEFVTHHINPTPDHAKVTIHRENGTFNNSNTQIWAFRYDGDFNFANGTLVAETSDKMDEEEAIRLLVAVDKNNFHPTKSVDMTMKELEEEAFKGSDYEEGMDFWSWVAVIFLFFVPLIMSIVHAYRVWHSKRMAKKDLLWYRDIPYKGNLVRANCILNAHRYRKVNYDNLISASVLRLISIGALRIENHFVEASGLSKMMGQQGGIKQCIAIYEMQQTDGLVNFPMLTLLYKIFSDAAGDDRILQPKELKKFMNKNPKRVEELMKVAMQKMSIKDVNNDMENVRKVYGLRKFLKDFTLANERHVQEVALWKEYLVWAELFGIAKQVRADMKKINPEYLRFDDFYQTMLNEDVVRNVTVATLLATRSTIGSSRSGGGGGFASRGGGGGGFSGGGGGGGVR